MTKNYFSPIPNWLPTFMTFPSTMIKSSNFSLCTSRPISSFSVATIFLLALLIAYMTQ